MVQVFTEKTLPTETHFPWLPVCVFRLAFQFKKVVLQTVPEARSAIPDKKSARAVSLETVNTRRRERTLSTCMHTIVVGGECERGCCHFPVEIGAEVVIPGRFSGGWAFQRAGSRDLWRRSAKHTHWLGETEMVHVSLFLNGGLQQTHNAPAHSRGRTMQLWLYYMHFLYALCAFVGLVLSLSWCHCLCSAEDEQKRRLRPCFHGTGWYNSICELI